MEVTNNKPTIKVVQVQGPRDSEAEIGTKNSSKNSSNFPQQPRNKRNDHLGLFRSASPVTTSSLSTNAADTNLFLALPAASRSHGGRRSLSATSLCNENGATCFLSDEKLLIK